MKRLVIGLLDWLDDSVAHHADVLAWCYPMWRWWNTHVCERICKSDWWGADAIDYPRPELG